MKVAFYTLGCKVNTYETEYLQDLFKRNGYTIASFDDVADVYVINTCSVTNGADAKSKKIIRQAIRKNPKACVIALGCFIEANKDLKMDGLSIMVGNTNKTKVLDYIEEWNKEKKFLNKTTESVTTKFESMELNNFLGRTRAFVKIQDGCDNYCAYCIIPFVRGHCRSKDFDTVIKEIISLTANGYKEVVLTGIHTGSYGIDNNESFAHLLEEICKIPGLERLRISSIEVTELNKEVLDVIKNNKVIVDHMHIPLQAGSEHILRLMKRKYNKKQFKSKIDELRSIRPDINITTDVIVGFPEETEEDFVEGMEFIKELGISKIHVFPYSRRKGTVADTMPQVNESIKKDRVNRLIELSKELEIKYMEKHIGKKDTVLIETNRDGYSVGHTGNYLLVKILGEYKSEDEVEVKLNKVEYPYVIGEKNE